MIHACFPNVTISVPNNEAVHAISVNTMPCCLRIDRTKFVAFIAAFLLILRLCQTLLKGAFKCHHRPFGN
jgi:hypothetical protein